MPDYRVYRIKNKHIDGVPAVITTDSDEDAVEQAKQLLDGHDIELWEGSRFVRGLKAIGHR